MIKILEAATSASGRRRQVRFFRAELQLRISVWIETQRLPPAGQGFTISAGGAIAGTADLAGGDLTLKSGTSTGTGSSAIRFFTATAGSTGITDNAPTEKVTILNNGNVGIGTTSHRGTIGHREGRQHC